MADRRLLDQAIAEMARNPEQLAAMQEKGHCVVLAGPGSGKTKTLTTAMARALLEDVIEPRGVACITYNNECAIELENRLAKLGINPSKRIFIGTVHSFALTQVIYPYARCVMPGLTSDFRLATAQECKDSVTTAYQKVLNAGENPQDRWRFAEAKRRKDVDRTQPGWMGQNPELARFIEAYEGDLRRKRLIDFDDMPLLAVKMIREHEWIRRSLHAKFPILFVDEYQDLGHALHELVLLLCFKSGARLFAVGDPDQSIYAFTGANPDLLQGLTSIKGVREIRLRFNYRCGTNIIEASKAALGEERDYQAHEDAGEGEVSFHGTAGDLSAQANVLIDKLLPAIQEKGTSLDQIAVLYRTARHGDEVAQAAQRRGLPIVRADTQALVKRSSRLSRFIEACARWVVGGWKDADPPFRRLAAEAVILVLGGRASREERQQIETELITFLHEMLSKEVSTHYWLIALRDQLIRPWRTRARTITEDWDAIDQMVQRTDPALSDGDMPLTHFGGRIDGRGRLNLSTLHSAKGREFDVVVLFGMNDDILPNYHEVRRPDQLREARRLFYVGVTRAKKELLLIFSKGQHSPWVKELYERTKSSGS